MNALWGTRGAQPRVLFLTEHPVDEAPHAEWTPRVLAKAGWQVEAWVPGASGSVVKRVLGVAWPTRTLYRSDAPPLLREWRIWWALVAVRLGRYDVVLIDSMSLAYRAALVFALPQCRQRLAYQARDFVDQCRWRLRSLLERILLRRADLHISHEYLRAYVLSTALATGPAARSCFCRRTCLPGGRALKRANTSGGDWQATPARKRSSCGCTAGRSSFVRLRNCSGR